MKKLTNIFLIFSFLCSCRPEDSLVGIISIPDSGWTPSRTLEFHLEQKQAGTRVDLLYQLQYDPEFPWENIWLSYQLQAPSGDTLMKSTDNLYLFQPGKGKPFGKGCRERLFIDAYFLKGIVLKDTGKYRLQVRHQMRTENLKGIQALGIRMKKSTGS
jgi:gliding motility-associated lipoprotein GldH